MKLLCKGIHHITAISAYPKANLGFYSNFLGLRLVKKTVNFDDPGSYHLYYGDEAGNPGTIMTFFLWPGAPRGRSGLRQATMVSYSIPVGSSDYWRIRAEEFGLSVEPVSSLGHQGLLVYDPDGIPIELIESGEPKESRSEIPSEAMVTGFFSVSMTVQDIRPTAELLTSLMGLEPVSDDGKRFRYKSSASPGQYVDLVQNSSEMGRLGAGTIHHVAFRARDDDDQADWLEGLESYGLNVTNVRDRTYFHSIYFREPSGVLFEIATDPPGFTVDEPIESLGEALKLPAWLENRRSEIETKLPPLK